MSKFRDFELLCLFMIFDFLFSTTTSHMVCSKTCKNINVVFFHSSKSFKFHLFFTCTFCWVQNFQYYGYYSR